jgi:serine/threonine-protein kinase
MDLQPPMGIGGDSATSTPAVEHSPTLERQFHFERLRSYARQSLDSVRALAADPIARAGGALAGAWGWLGRNRLLAAAILAAGLFAVGAWFVSSVRHGRIPSEARALLEEGKVAEVRELVKREVAHHPKAAELRLILGHALYRTPGQAAAAVDAYAAAFDGGALDDEALSNLVDDLGRDRPTADRAARLLTRVGERALPPILVATGEGPPLLRLRALSLARDLGAESRIDRVAAYLALLKEKDADCDTRVAAVTRLGEIGDPAALPALKERAKAFREQRSGFFGRVERIPACDSRDAARAVKRIEEARAVPAK